MQLEDWIKKFSSEREAVRYLMKETGFSERHIRRLIRGWKTDKLSTAIRLSKATGIPPENFLRPEAVEALLKLRISTTSHIKEQEESGKGKEEVTIGK